MTEDRRRPWLPWVLVALLLVGLLWATERRARTAAVARADSLSAAAAASRATATAQEGRLAQQQAVIDSLGRVDDSLRLLAVRARGRSRIAAAQWDTLWLPGGAADTLPLARIRALGDSAIAACQAEVLTCEQRLTVVREQADSLRGKADSAAGAAASWHAAADQERAAAQQWKKVARGPWLALAVEGTITTGGVPQGAGELTLGRGHLKVLGRVEVGQAGEQCGLTADAYTCRAPVAALARVGVRWTF